MFFEGDSPCRGRVLVKSFGETEARPLEDNKTEANNICRAMQCGDVVPSIEQNGTYGTYDNITCSGMCAYNCNFLQTCYLSKCDLNN